MSPLRTIPNLEGLMSHVPYPLADVRRPISFSGGFPIYPTMSYDPVTGVTGR
jgi:hypothetical protein